MRKRPLSVTIISWYLIISSVVTLAATTVTRNNLRVIELMGRNMLPVSVQFILMYISFFVSVACGMAMLNGRGWARLIYVCWSVIGIAMSFIASPMRLAMAPSVAIFAVIAFFLFRPKAGAYFRGEFSADSPGAA